MTADLAHALVDGIDLSDRPPRLWTVSEVARAARLSEWAVRQAIARAELRAIRRGRLLRVPDADARRFLGQ